MYNNKFYKIGAGIGIIVIISIVACIVAAKKNEMKIAKENNPEASIMSSANLIENEIGNTTKTNPEGFNVIEEKKDDKKDVKNNTRNQEKQTKKVNTKDEKKEDTKETTAKEEKQESTKDPTFKYPVKGEIIQNYAKENLVYSQTLGEWITHTGIDIKANKTTVVGVAADGKVKYIKNDPRFGLTVVVEHSNGFSTVYSNLLTAEFVSVGENVKEGQTLGTVGNTAAFEILDEPHLHFEILKDGEAVDPNMYLKN